MWWGRGESGGEEKIRWRIQVQNPSAINFNHSDHAVFIRNTAFLVEDDRPERR